MSTTTIDAAPLTLVELKMSTLDMGWLSRGLLAAAAKDDVYGARCHAHIVADGLTATASSTDGYRMHQMHLPLRAPVEPTDVIIPREALIWAGKNVRTFTPKKDALLEPTATLVVVVPAIPEETQHPGWVSVIYREWDDENAPSARFDDRLIGEKYPPLDRLIDSVRTADVGVPPTIQYTTTTAGRPGPALLDFWEGAVLRATALIQPSRTEDEA